MARRRGRPNNYLMVDDNSGFTTYADRLHEDYWGNYTKYELKRNLQEISSPMGDPYPVPVFRGSQYEATTACMFETSPIYIGKTTKAFTQSAYGQLVNLDPAIPDMEVGCTFIVRGDNTPTGDFLLDDNGNIITDDSGNMLLAS